MSDTVKTVPADSLSEQQLRTLLDWDPDFAGLDPKPMLVAAARNRYGADIPLELIPVAA